MRQAATLTLAPILTRTPTLTPTLTLILTLTLTLRAHHGVAQASFPEEARHRRDDAQVVEAAARREEAGDLPVLQIDRDDLVQPLVLEDRRHVRCGDRLAAAHLSVLPAVPVVGDDRDHPLGRRAAQRTHDEGQLDDVVVDGVARRLDDVCVPPADALVDGYVELTAVALLVRAVRGGHAQQAADFLGQVIATATREDAAFARVPVHAARKSRRSARAAAREQVRMLCSHVIHPKFLPSELA